MAFLLSRFDIIKQNYDSTGLYLYHDTVGNKLDPISEVEGDLLATIKADGFFNDVASILQKPGGLILVSTTDGGGLFKVTQVYNTGTTVPAVKIKEVSSANANIADGSVIEAKLAANAVTTDKIKDAAVTAAKLAANAVIEASIAANAVTAAKIAANAVTADKIANAVITDDKLAATAKIGNITTLTTTAKNSIVAAINELDTRLKVVEAK